MKGGCYPGIRAGAVGLGGRRASGALDRRARRGAAERRAGARQRRRGGAGARTGRQVPRAAHAVGVGDRRLLFDRPADHPADDRHGVPRQHLYIRGGARRGHGGADQHDDDRALSRRQPARADLRHRERSSTRRRGNWASTRPNCAAATRSRRARCRTRRRCGRPTTAAISRRTCGDALALADYDRIAERREAARRRGKLLGIGVATTVAATGGRDYEHAEIRFDPAGGVVLLTGSMDHGQGHATTFKQVLSDKLGIDADKIRYRWGDSDLVTMGIGTFGSRSAQLAGSAIVGAADRLIEKGRQHRGAYDGGGGRRHRVRARPVPDRRHRPRGRRSTRSRAGRSSRRNCRTTSRSGLPSARISGRRTPRRFRPARMSARSRSTPRPARSR